MTALWESAGYEPVFPTEATLLGLAYADQGDSRAVPLLERLCAYYPVEAAAIEIHLLCCQGQFECAGEELEQMLQTLRQHPWGLADAIELALWQPRISPSVTGNRHRALMPPCPNRLPPTRITRNA